MGRGLGAVQRRVLDLLAAERRNWTITEITTAIHGESHTDSHRRGVARAVSSLAERGLVRTMLSARRFRVVTVRRPAYVPRYLEPENGEQYGGVVVESIFRRPVPIPEMVVWLPGDGPDQTPVDATMATDRRLNLKRAVYGPARV